MTKQMVLWHHIQIVDAGSFGGPVGHQELEPFTEEMVHKEGGPPSPLKITNFIGEPIIDLQAVLIDFDDADRITGLQRKFLYRDNIAVQYPQWEKLEIWKAPVEHVFLTDGPTVETFDTPILELKVGEPLTYSKDEYA